MKINSYLAYTSASIIACLVLPVAIVLAQEAKEAAPVPQKEAAPEAGVVQQEAAPAPAEKETSPEITLSQAQNVTLDFKDADILNVLKIIAYKSGVNIVCTPEVMGNVTMKLLDVPWEMALDVILKTYGFAYQRQGNIILVTKLENIAKIQAEEPLQTEIFNLKFLDAQDAEKILAPLLSPRGKISVLYSRGQKGWQFGTFQVGRQRVAGLSMAKEQEGAAKSETISIEKNPAGELISRKAEFEPSIKSKVLVITDTVVSLDRIRNVILPQIDKKTRQVLIEARLVEVSRDKLRDLGFDWGLGSSTAAESAAIVTQSIDKHASSSMGAHSLASLKTPSIFGPKEGTTLFPGTEPYNLGAELIFQKLTGTKFEAIIHALEEDVHTNTLSAPRILTLDNQEASILVGYHTPILKSELSTDQTTGGSKLTQTLDYYQEIGIRLNVVPQINEEGYINMIIHPSITSSTSSVPATSYVGNATTATNYPIIDVRETQTQILVKDNETVVIGGLLKDIKGKETIGIPFLSKIPIFGSLFRRDTYDTQKIDLLIFITARILKENELTPEEIAKLERQLGEDRVAKQEAKSKEKRK